MWWSSDHKADLLKVHTGNDVLWEFLETWIHKTVSEFVQL